jgi:SpoVK/Ycf46/Vps4 family AAA+-type ATPase
MARSIAPCFILLDNIEVILGAPVSATAAAAGGGALPGKRHHTRTTHKAIDRILSTLLVELDGIEDPSERLDSSAEAPGQVIVIATTSSQPRTLDR